jgi:hypothetical protein
VVSMMLERIMVVRTVMDWTHLDLLCAPQIAWEREIMKVISDVVKITVTV